MNGQIRHSLEVRAESSASTSLVCKRTGERWPTKTLAVEASLISHNLMERSLEPVAT